MAAARHYTCSLVIEQPAITNYSINIISGERLHPGDVISARIIEALPGGRFRLLWNGRKLTAESGLPLVQGSVIRARVESTRGSTTLRLLSGNDAAMIPSGSGNATAQQGPVQSLVASFLRASMPLPSDPELQRLASLLSRTRGSLKRMARLQADMVSRGVDPGADFLEALDGLLSGRSRRDGDWSGPGSHKNATGLSPEELKQALGDSDEPLLDLINENQGRHDNWTFHRTGGDEDDPVVMWKIRRGGYRPALSLTVRDGNRHMEFHLEGLQPVAMTVYKSESTEISQSDWDNFRERLSLMNVRVGGTISQMEDSDGFSSAAHA